MKKKLITAIVTPLLGDKKIDYISLENLIEKQINGGADGILFAGSTGEKFGISEQIFFELCDFVVKKYKNVFDIIFNVGTCNTVESISNAKKCQDIGVDAILVSTPYYNKATQDGIYLHFKSIANSVNIPVYLYNIPGRTGVNIDIKTLKKLIEIKNIKGIKESSGNFSQIIDTFKILQTRKDFEIFCGDDNLVYPFLTLGASGTISVISNIFPKQVKQILSTFENKINEESLETAKNIFLNIFSLSENLCKIGNNPIAIKTILAGENLILENFFEPLCSLNEHEKEKLLNIFQETKNLLSLD